MIRFAELTGIQRHMRNPPCELTQKTEQRQPLLFHPDLDTEAIIAHVGIYTGQTPSVVLQYIKSAAVEEVFRSFTQGKVPVQQCKNTLLEVKALHSKFYTSQNEVWWSKFTLSIKSKSTRSA